MTSHSNRYPTVVAVNHMDLGDALGIASREVLDLGDVLTEAMHVGMAVLLDKHETRVAVQAGKYGNLYRDLDDYTIAVMIYLESYDPRYRKEVWPAQLWAGARARLAS